MKKIISILILFFLFIPYSSATYGNENKIKEKNNYEKNYNLKATVSFRKFSLRKSPEKNSKIFGVLSFGDNLEILEFLNDNWLKVKVLSGKKENKIGYIKKRAVNIQNISIAKNITITKEKKYLSGEDELDLSDFFSNLFSDENTQNNGYEEPEYLNNTYQNNEDDYYQAPPTQHLENLDNNYDIPEYINNNYEVPEYQYYSNNSYETPEYQYYNNSNIDYIDPESLGNNILNIFEEDERNGKYKEIKWVNKFNFYDYIFGGEYH